MIRRYSRSSDRIKKYNLDFLSANRTSIESFMVSRGTLKMSTIPLTGVEVRVGIYVVFGANLLVRHSMHA